MAIAQETVHATMDFILKVTNVLSVLITVSIAITHSNVEHVRSVILKNH